MEQVPYMCHNLHLTKDLEAWLGDYLQTYKSGTEVPCSNGLSGHNKIYFLYEHKVHLVQPLVSGET